MSSSRQCCICSAMSARPSCARHCWSPGRPSQRCVPRSRPGHNGDRAWDRDGTRVCGGSEVVNVADVPETAHWMKSVDIGAHPAGWLPNGIADVNHDGTGDLLWYNAATPDGDIWLVQNGAWSASSDVGIPPPGYAISGTSDFNHDGTSDVLWFNPATRDTDIWLLSNGHWAGSTTIGTHPAGSQLVGVGDFDHNGVSDIMWRDLNTGHIDTWLLAYS